LIVLAILAGFLFFTLVFLILSKRISRNLGDVVNQVNGMANGDYTEKIHLNGIFELEQLSRSINQMGDTIDAKISELSEKNAEMLRLMVEALDANDAYTKGHSERVAKLSGRLGEAVGYEDMDQLISAALLHDIGKITVPETILNKPDRLTAEEFEIIKAHTVVGKRILSQSSAFNDIDDLVLYHHERVDGAGYPEGLDDSEIPSGAKIIAICDVYDALTTARPYRGAMSHEAALDIIREAKGKQFSAAYVDAFLLLDIKKV
jgi:putative nucleotidyltransferase with HDIG domain